MKSALSTFEASLADLDIPVTRVDRDEFSERIDDLVEPPAVGVPLDETFDDPALSFAGTSVRVDPTPVALREATTGVTGAQIGVADYGSLALSCTDRASELVSLFVDRYVVAVREADVVPDMDAAIEELQATFDATGGSAVLATGPSATADMGALVKGAHGPSEVHVVLVEGGE